MLSYKEFAPLLEKFFNVASHIEPHEYESSYIEVIPVLKDYFKEYSSEIQLIREKLVKGNLPVNRYCKTLSRETKIKSGDAALKRNSAITCQMYYTHSRETEAIAFVMDYLEAYGIKYKSPTFDGLLFIPRSGEDVPGLIDDINKSLRENYGFKYIELRNRNSNPEDQLYAPLKELITLYANETKKDDDFLKIRGKDFISILQKHYFDKKSSIDDDMALYFEKSTDYLESRFRFSERSKIPEENLAMNEEMLEYKQNILKYEMVLAIPGLKDFLQKFTPADLDIKHYISYKERETFIRQAAKKAKIIEHYSPKELLISNSLIYFIVFNLSKP